jgi:hypothetical protein
MGQIQILNPFIRTVTFLVGFAIIVFLLITSIETGNSNDKIWIEVENAKEIDPKLKIIDDKEASGGKGITSLLPSHDIRAFASYNFTALNSGTYHTWLRAYWPGACSNSFFLKIDHNVNLLLIGNDNMLDIWHWIPGPTFELKAGNHNLYIWNDEFDARLDKILLTTDPYYKPQGKGESFAFFTDFEEHMSQFLHPQNSRLWKIVKDKNTDNSSLFLNGGEEGQPEYSFINITNGKEYFFSCNARECIKNENTDIQILFNYLNNHNYYKAEFTKNTLSVTVNKNGLKRRIGYFKGDEDLIDTCFNQYSIIYNNSNIVFKFHGKTLISLSDSSLRGGKIAFGSKSRNIYFDDLENLMDLTPLFQEHYFMTWKEGEGPLRLQPYSGKWTFGQFGIMSLEAMNYNSSEAFSYLGKEFWRNYRFAAAVKTGNEAGLCFYVQDAHNYFVYKMICGNNNTGKLQLLKVEKAQSRILCERPWPLKSGEWHRLEVKLNNDSIRLFFDNKNVLSYKDCTFTDGKIGFWCNSPNLKSLFDDIVVSPTIIAPHVPAILNYEFEIRQKAGVDLCDWENSGNIFRRKNYSGWNDQIVIEKELFKESAMWNKKSFSGNVGIKVHHIAIPRDVDANIMFRAINRGKTDEYKFIAGSDGIRLIKNNNIVLEKKLNFDKSLLIVKYTGDKWIFKSKDQVIFEYPDKFNYTSMKLGLGYSGAGIGDISIGNVSISYETFVN